jgi:serine/threonine-protein kinase
MADSQRTIDRLCGRLEALLLANERADLGAVLGEDAVGRLGADERQILFRELLLIEIGHRRRAGLAVDRADYERRFGEYRDAIRQVFESPSAATGAAWDEADEGATVGIGPEPEQAPVTLANRFTNLRFHARGGLGEVFRAHDESLHRDIAVKFIRPQRAGDAASRDRFLLEGEITARLDHPGVVPVYGLGETFDGRAFLAMRFIDGKTLRAAVDEYHAGPTARPGERRRELNRLLHHLVAACNAVAYAHSRGIVHRDIKPDNIMIGRFNETLVVDWGLAVPGERDARAKASGEQTMHVASGSGDSRSQPAAGTIGYFSPESLDGHLVACGPRSDVYSLGGTLYYLLTGRRSVAGGMTPETLATIRTGSFPSPQAVDRRVPRPLDAVCRKAMAVHPADRYDSPLTLAADLEAFIEDEPVSVLEETHFERLRRTARHHRGIVLAVLTGLVAVAAVAGLSAVWLNRQAASERQARELAQLAERDGVQLAATFAAQTVAGEIDVRWRILEALAADPILRQLLGELAAGTADDPAAVRERLQAWLLARVQAYDSVGADSWFIMSGLGEQLARRPFEARTVGKSYATRDYFHGQGRELPAAGAGIEPIRGPHLCRAYDSSSDGGLKIAYSVPIWALTDVVGAGRPVGVLAMTARAGEFRILRQGLSRGQVGVLVDLRGQGGEDDPPGLVLHHPELARRQQERIASGGEAAREFLPADVVARLETLLRLARLGQDADAVVEADYRDGLWPDDAARWIAAFKPVVIENRPHQHPEQRHTGLAVIVQLCPEPLPGTDSR